jgi:hypothetical protein
MDDFSEDLAALKALGRAMTPTERTHKRRRIEALLLPDDVDVVLQLDGLAEAEQRQRAFLRG